MKRIFFCLLTSIILVMTPLKVNAKEKVVIPQEIQELCEKYGEEYEICPELLESMVWHESRCNPKADNGSCKGLTQINPRFFGSRMKEFGVTDLFDAEQNIKVCASTLRDYFEECDDVYYVLMCWNSGTNKAKKLYEDGLYTKYAVKVSQTSYELERSHGK